MSSNLDKRFWIPGRGIPTYLLNKVLERKLKNRECELKKIEKVSVNKLTGCDKHRKCLGMWKMESEVVRENE